MHTPPGRGQLSEQGGAGSNKLDKGAFVGFPVFRRQKHCFGGYPGWNGELLCSSRVRARPAANLENREPLSGSQFCVDKSATLVDSAVDESCFLDLSWRRGPPKRRLGAARRDDGGSIGPAI